MSCGIDLMISIDIDITDEHGTAQRHRKGSRVSVEKTRLFSPGKAEVSLTKASFKRLSESGLSYVTGSTGVTPQLTNRV